MTTEEIHNFNINIEDIEIVIQMKTGAKKSRQS